MYTQQWCMSYRFADSLRAKSGRTSGLILLASCQQNCMTYIIAVCTVQLVLLHEENAKCNYYDIQYKNTSYF